MAKIITIPNDNDSVLNAERSRISVWAPANAWIFTGYNTQIDHVAKVRAAGNPVEVLDIVCHGAPTIFDHTDMSTVNLFGSELSKLPGFSSDSVIYLDACNTGLTSTFGGPIAQSLANAAGCTVYGTKGYMTGTFAEATERCFRSTSGLPPYPGGTNAVGRNVWIPFHPVAPLAAGLPKINIMSLSINLDSLRPESNEANALLGVVETVLGGEPVEFPQLRMAPDATINYSRGNERMILDIYANGALVKERISGQCWRVADNKLNDFQIKLRQAFR